jgi:Fe-S oxidoreductase
MLKADYPKMLNIATADLGFNVVHLVEFADEMVKKGTLKLSKPVDVRLTYHDSCFLGRHNKVFSEPREILKNIRGAELVEMARRQEKGFCCGAGGGHMWMEEEADKRVNVRRIDDVICAKVNLVATACPYCLAMFEDALKAKVTGAAQTIAPCGGGFDKQEGVSILQSRAHQEVPYGFFSRCHQVK